MDNQNNKNKGPNNNRQGWGIILFTTLLITFIVMGLFSLMRGGTPEEISYDKFLKLVDNKKVESVTFTNSRINIVLTDSARKEKLKGTLKEVKDESKKSSSSKESTEKSSTSDSSKDSSSSAGENGTYDLISQLQEQMQDSGDTEEKDPDYYTGLVNDETLVEKLKRVECSLRQKCRIRQVLCHGAGHHSCANHSDGIVVRIFYEADDQRRRYDGHRKEQCQDVYGEADRSHIPECCRTG